MLTYAGVCGRMLQELLHACVRAGRYTQQDPAAGAALRYRSEQHADVDILVHKVRCFSTKLHFSKLMFACEQLAGFLVV
jgi:hypothetical protein